MNNAEAMVAIFGMIAGVLVTWGIAWGIVAGIKARYASRNSDPSLEGEIAALRDQVDQMQHQLAEVHERIDFTERLLSQARPAEQLPRGAP
jgi:hypothetical protein